MPEGKSITANPKKWIPFDGEVFKNDEAAQTAADEWEKLPANAGWKYKGNHKLVNDAKESEFEVV